MGMLFPVARRLPASFAGLAMSLSSVMVVCSSLALRVYSPPEVRSDGTLDAKGIVRWLLPAGGQGGLAAEEPRQAAAATAKGILGDIAGMVSPRGYEKVATEETDQRADDDLAFELIRVERGEL